MLNLAEIEAEVLHYASRIGAPGELLPTYGRSKDGGHPHIEVDSHSYHYVVVERGSELQRVTTADFETLLEEIFLDITSSLAFAYEGAHRIEEHDCRRMALPRQIELLALLRPEWAERESRRHEEILRRNPFDDLSSVRARLCKAFRDGGRPPDTAWADARRRYPLPIGEDSSHHAEEIGPTIRRVMAFHGIDDHRGR